MKADDREDVPGDQKARNPSQRGKPALYSLYGSTRDTGKRHELGAPRMVHGGRGQRSYHDDLLDDDDDDDDDRHRDHQIMGGDSRYQLRHMATRDYINLLGNTIDESSTRQSTASPAIGPKRQKTADIMSTLNELNDDVNAGNTWDDEWGDDDDDDDTKIEMVPMTDSVRSTRLAIEIKDSNENKPNQVERQTTNSFLAEGMCVCVLLKNNNNNNNNIF